MRYDFYFEHEKEDLNFVKPDGLTFATVPQQRMLMSLGIDLRDGKRMPVTLLWGDEAHVGREVR